MKQMHISSVVCSPCVTRFGGLFGLSGFASELSYLAVIEIFVPLLSFTGSANRYCPCHLKSQSFTQINGISFWSGVVASTFISRPIKCMCGVIPISVMSVGSVTVMCLV